MGESSADVETGNEEEAEEESLDPEIPTNEKNPKNIMIKAQQEREDCGHVFYRHWCAMMMDLVTVTHTR